jgi:hypothetical protein
MRSRVAAERPGFRELRLAGMEDGLATTFLQEIAGRELLRGAG